MEIHMHSDPAPVLSAPRRTTGELIDHRIDQLHSVGTGLLRYSVVLLLLVFGAAKFFAFEARGVEPLVAHSPLMSWMLHVFGVRGTSDVIGVIEIAAGLAMASRRFSPRLSAYGSAAGIVIFLITVSFIFTTPGALSVQSPAFGFLVKDVVLLGACVATAAEALRALRPLPAR
jgi:uncharacterized membrane protein YkgB